MSVPAEELMKKLVSMTKRTGFIFQSSELYGGINGAWDYGPLGVELKRNVKDAWWKAMVRDREDIVGLDSAILMHPMVWRASGHVANFADPMIDCKKCKKRYRVDEIDPEYENTGIAPTICPDPKCKGELTPARKFNLMFETHLGPVADSAAKTYLRPETAQGIFANFINVTDSTRIKVPFGIAQIGKSFRNEINPRNFTFRSREFEQMEMEFFCKPGSDDEWFEYWVEQRKKWYASLGITMEKLRFRAHEKEKLSHYSKATTDVEYLFPFGWGELEGIANRTDFDLRAHQIGMRSVGKWKGEELQDFQLVEEDAEYHKGKLSYFDEAEKRRYIPYVIEPAAGADRATLGVLVRRVRRGRGRRRGSHCVALASAAGARQSGDLPAREEGRHARARAQSLHGAQEEVAGRLRRVGRHRPSLPPQRRDRHALVHHHRRRHAHRRHRHRARARFDEARARRRRPDRQADRRSPRIVIGSQLTTNTVSSPLG